MTGAARSYLFVPGHSKRMLAKAFELGADALVLDFEDGVPAGYKDRARELVQRAIAARHNSGRARPFCWVRINALADTDWRDDLRAVVQPGIAGIRVPKVRSLETLEELDKALRPCEERAGLRVGSIRLTCNIESAAGLMEARAIAVAPRVSYLAFGAADFAADMGCRCSPSDRSTLFAHPGPERSASVHTGGQGAWLLWAFFAAPIAARCDSQSLQPKRRGYNAGSRCHPAVRRSCCVGGGRRGHRQGGVCGSPYGAAGAGAPGVGQGHRPRERNPLTRSFKSPVWELLKGCRVYDLSQPLEEGIPVSPNHPGFRLALKRRHGDAQRADGSSSANELLMLGGHTGTHIDALCHVSHQGMLHGGVNAFEAQRGGRFAQLGVETIAPILCRGVMLDLPAFMGVEILEPGAPVTANDLEAVAQRQGVQVQAGDAVLVRTGWGHLWKDPQAFEGESSGTPGPEESAARWLAELGVRLTGGETLAYEQIVAESGHSQLPVHRILLVEAGIHTVESMQLCELAHDKVFEFLFVVAPVKIAGATGMPVRPLAIARPDERS